MEQLTNYDAWKLVAAQIYGIDYAEVTPEQRNNIKREAFYRAFGGKYCVIEDRTTAQVINFVKVYGEHDETRPMHQVRTD